MNPYSNYCARLVTAFVLGLGLTACSVVDTIEGKQSSSQPSPAPVANPGPITAPPPPPPAPLPPPGQPQPLVTQIQSPSSTDAPNGVWTSSTLHVVFGVAGSQPGENILWECEQAGETTFSTCNKQDSSANYVDLTGLTDGQQVTMQVMAVDRDTGTQAQPALLNLTVKLAGADQPPAQPIVSSFQVGQDYAYTVAPIVLSVGGTYQTMPVHVTEYATTMTTNAQLAFYRITATGAPVDPNMPLVGQTDPYYNGNYNCGSSPWDRRVPGGSPSGTTWDYCESTPTFSGTLGAGFNAGGADDFYKWLTGGNLAYNHLEVATDPTAPIRTIIDMNNFDQNVEYMSGRSLFEKLCGNQAVSGNIQATPAIRFIDRDFWGEKVTAVFFMCHAPLVDTLPSLPVGSGTGAFNPEADYYNIGTFFISTTGLNLPAYECMTKQDTPANNPYGLPAAPYSPTACASFMSPNLLEVTFMTKNTYDGPEFFALDAQAAFIKSLHEITPVM